MVIGARPALTISSPSSSSRTVGASTNTAGGLPARHQLLVQLDEALLINAPFADEHLLAGKIVQRGDGRRAWSGDDYFADVRARRLREGGELSPARA